MCHILLLAPVFGLFLVWLMPMPVAGPVYAVLVLQSILLYIITMRTMRSPHLTGSESLQRKTGQIIDVTDRGARVRIKWFLSSILDPVS